MDRNEFTLGRGWSLKVGWSNRFINYIIYTLANSVASTRQSDRTWIFCKYQSKLFHEFLYFKLFWLSLKLFIPPSFKFTPKFFLSNQHFLVYYSFLPHIIFWFWLLSEWKPYEIFLKRIFIWIDLYTLHTLKFQKLWYRTQLLSILEMKANFSPPKRSQP